jgi:hypothetical protein
MQRNAEVGLFTKPSKEIEKSPEIREAYLGISWLRLARFKAVFVPQ